MTIGYRVMGSGPGPERIGSGRHRLCGVPVLLQPRSGVQACLLYPNCLSAWTEPACSCVYSRRNCRCKQHFQPKDHEMCANAVYQSGAE